MLKKIVFLMLAVLPTLYAEASYKVVGYYPNWGMYHLPNCKPLNLPGHLLTHINYAFLKVDESGTLHLFDPWADREYREDWNTTKPFWGHLGQLVQLKKKYPHLKTLVSIGGWTLSNSFSQMAGDPISRERFVANCVAFCKQYQLNGVDLDWEYPGFEAHKGRPEDKDNFTLLIMELSEALHRESFLLTIASPAANPHMHNMELAKIHPHLDWINIMTYDYSGAGWSEKTNHLAPLYPPKEGDPKWCVDSTIKAYIAEGVPREKIVMGLPFYGRSFASVEAGKNGLHCAHKGEGYSTTAEKGVVFFSDIEKLMENGYVRLFDPDAESFYLYHPDKQEFISYDDLEAIRAKCEYLKEYGLGGVMIWELTNDKLPEHTLLNEIHDKLS